MYAKGKDGKWHTWGELSKEDREAWMDAMTEADRRHDDRKRHGKPRTLKQRLIDYETDRRIC